MAGTANPFDSIIEDDFTKNTDGSYSLNTTKGTMLVDNLYVILSDQYSNISKVTLTIKDGNFATIKISTEDYSSTETDSSYNTLYFTQTSNITATLGNIGSTAFETLSPQEHKSNVEPLQTAIDEVKASNYQLTFSQEVVSTDSSDTTTKVWDIYLIPADSTIYFRLKSDSLSSAEMVLKKANDTDTKLTVYSYDDTAGKSITGVATMLLSTTSSAMRNGPLLSI